MRFLQQPEAVLPFSSDAVCLPQASHNTVWILGFGLSGLGAGIPFLWQE